MNQDRQRAILRIMLALLVQGAVVGAALWWGTGTLPLVPNCIGWRWTWIAAPAMPLAALGLAPAWIYLAVVVLLLSLGVILLGRPAAKGTRSWIYLVVCNGIGAGLYCLLAAVMACYWPVPKPFITPYDAGSSEARTKYRSWYEVGYRSGTFGQPMISCVLGWAPEESSGYNNGHYVGYARTGCRIFRHQRAFSTPAIAALLAGDVGRVHQLVNNRNINDRDFYNQSVLIVACSSGFDIPQTIDHLIARGADVNAADRWGHTPLSYAAANAKLDVVERLVAAGANVQAKDRYGSSPLHRAAYAGKPEVVRFLIDHGNPVDVADKNGKTPLMEAAFGGSVPVAEVVLACGANPNLKDKDGRNPLQWALLSSWEDQTPNPVMSLLVKAGADLRFLETLPPEQRERFQKHLTKSQAAKPTP